MTPELPNAPIIGAVVLLHHADGATTQLVVDPDHDTEQIVVTVDMHRDPVETWESMLHHVPPPKAQYSITLVGGGYRLSWDHHRPTIVQVEPGELRP